MRTIGTPSTQARKLNAIASGALPNGDPVIVNADGTVSVVEETSSSEATGSTGTMTGGTFSSSSKQNGVYDPSANRIVVVYADTLSSRTPYYVLGTITGTSISWSTPATIPTATSTIRSSMAVSYDPSVQKVVIFYKRNNSAEDGGVLVGDVGASSITFGSDVAVNSGTQISLPMLVYAENVQKTVLLYNDVSGSQHGEAIVADISGTTITLNTASSFTGSNLNPQTGSATYDSVNDKIVVTYGAGSASDYGYCSVGSVSGTTASFGTPVVYESSVVNQSGTSVDIAENKVLVCYRSISGSNYGKYRIGTISGNSISFTASANFFASSMNYPAVAYDAAAGKHLVTYQDVNASDEGRLRDITVSGNTATVSSDIVSYGRSASNQVIYDDTIKKNVVFWNDSAAGDGEAFIRQNAYTSTNLTAENYIGLSSNGYPDTAGATIDVQGAINDRQSGLTAGQAYYVQTDGTLTTTAGDPSVFAGTAISATKMIVKG